MSRRRALRITAVSGIGLALGGTLVRELLRRAGLHRVSETRSRLGTLVSLTAVHPEPAGARAVVAAGFAEIDRLEAVLSRHAPGAALARLNRAGVLERPPSALLDVLGRARRWHVATAGAFDPTVLPLLRLWEGSGGALPPDAALAGARARVGFEGVEVGEDAVRFAHPGMALTLDGIAKGHVVDRTVATLVAAGAERVLVDAGGDLASGGPGAEAEPWTVGIQDPREPRALAGRVHLAGDAAATSGDYMRAFTPDRRHHHIVDPRTGRSPDHTSGVTVVTGTAMDADALSTALLVLGPEEGLALLEALPGAEGVIVAKDGARFPSRGMMDMVG